MPGVRAALVWNTSTAELARQHNDANVVAVGGRQHTVEEATELVLTFLRTPFSHDERHVRRIGLIAEYEQERHHPAGAEMGGDDVRTAVDEAVAVLSRVPDPTAPVLDTDVAGVVWHIGECLHWYGHDLLLGRVDLTAGRYERDPDAGYGRLVTGLTTWGEVLARVLDAADPGSAASTLRLARPRRVRRDGLRRGARAHRGRRRGGRAALVPAGRRGRRDAGPGVPRRPDRHRPGHHAALGHRPRRPARSPAADVLALRLGTLRGAPTAAQNESGLCGATGQENDVEASATAPGLTSVIRPARSSVPSETPPR
ncbi:RpiB/LacA/LacB family sugar-phosphate isomerase [Klenkia terrae]|uniref:RpiB/LacA/LacB family sugar-phosphate isomerase n=1 Tax=Klenkia terrae TaxID=1052259 RepID=UPI003618BBFC